MGESDPGRERERDRRDWIRRIASGVVEVTLLGVVIWAVTTGGLLSGDSPTETPRPTAPTPTPHLYWPTPS